MKIAVAKELTDGITTDYNEAIQTSNKGIQKYGNKDEL